jgi:hypothetical protein
VVAGLPRQRSRGRHRAVRDVRSGVRIGLYRRGGGASRSGCPMSFGPFAGTYDSLFRGAWLKWAHGLGHAQALDADIEAFSFDGHRDPLLGVQADYDPRRRGFSVRATAIAPVPSRWGLMLGDVAHNYRSALDHIAWAVVCRGRKPPTVLTEGQQRAVQFPIADERAAFNSSLRSRLPGARRGDVGVIRRRQPYHYIQHAIPAAALPDCARGAQQPRQAQDAAADLGPAHSSRRREHAHAGLRGSEAGFPTSADSAGSRGRAHFHPSAQAWYCAPLGSHAARRRRAEHREPHRREDVDRAVRGLHGRHAA